MSELTAILVLAATCGVLAFLLPFALHRTWLLVLARRESAPLPGGWRRPLPSVTVQLPVYNEAGVVERLIDAASQLDHPTHLLQIQVLDDSTDDTSTRAARAVARWRRRGVDIQHVRRPTRAGFKAGALAHGLDTARGEFLVILDADFVPAPDLIRRLLDGFDDARIGMVQARWDHLNEDANGLTRAQALLLDGHFFFEQGGRHAGGRFFNFNGTAGMWRRACLEDAGGWSADTLTEDLDLSYRAQMAGWRFRFLPDYGVPAELPPRVGSLEVQQKRWAQGGIQTARKVLPELLRMDLPVAIKAEAVVHLLGHLAHPLTLTLGLLILPSALARRALGLEAWLWLDLLVFGMATVPFLVFYGAAARTRDRPWRSVLPAVLRTLALGIGLSAAVSRAVVRGAGSARDPFVRTPKEGDMGGRYRTPAGTGDLRTKGLLAGLLTVSLVVAVAEGLYGSLPFLMLFLAGYVWLGVSQIRERAMARPASTRDVQQKQTEERQPDQRAYPGGLRPLAGVVEHV